MPRARTSFPSQRQTAAPVPENGCLSGFFLPPLAVLLVGGLLAFMVRGLPPTASAGSLAGTSQNDGPVTNSLAPLFTAEVQNWGTSIIRWATAAELDPNLAAVVMQIESCGDPRAQSSAGAIGLFQVMPYHFSPWDDPYLPDTNAHRGLDYLKRALEVADNNPRLALAGYNGGIGVIKRNEATWSPETTRYVYYGNPIYEDARQGATSSPMLDEWYRRFGASLCLQAHQRLGLR